MRILVLSDSHRNTSELRDALEAQPTADTMIFLGDGVDDLDAVSYLLTAKREIRVSGNCDFMCAAPASTVAVCDGIRIYCTHGHRECVKNGTGFLVASAKKSDATIALYGHTPLPKYDFRDGVHLFNPGSVNEGCYGIINIADGKPSFETWEYGCNTQTSP